MIYNLKRNFHSAKRSFSDLFSVEQLQQRVTTPEAHPMERRESKKNRS
jgi:hypothetical protein